VYDEVEAPTPDLEIVEEPFLREIKALNQKALEGVPLLSGMLDIGHVIEWLEGIEDYFKSENLT
jgi:hypothetical protein